MVSGLTADRSRARLRDGSLAGISIVAGGLFLAFVAIALLALVFQRPATGGWASFELDGTSRELVRRALLVSFESTLACVLVIVITGTPLALLLARPFRGREVLEAFVSLPVVLPPVVAGLALLLAFGRRGLLGHALDAAGIHIPFTLVAVVMAQTLVAAPLYIIAARNAFEQTNPELVDAAATLRASFTYTVWRVILPPVLPALGAGLALAWARALGEFGATLMFAGNLPGVTQTMPVAIFFTAQTNLEVAVTISLILLAISFLVLVATRFFQTRMIRV
ncbi:MAG: molybdate ABC transporter permease subunit [Candidatus Eremiobacteraeota bacterium]|nr:molybdate ABC transporter permease subunit [Candidatus Eremiobacteraeota bacterium]